jgi:DNA repair protein RecO (recombination protein O)
MGETDRLLTILTTEFGLVRGIAPGSRKHKSRLGDGVIYLSLTTG